MTLPILSFNSDIFSDLLKTFPSPLLSLSTDNHNKQLGCFVSPLSSSAWLVFKCFSLIFLKFIPDGIPKASEIITKNLRVSRSVSSFHLFINFFYLFFCTKSES